ncbi:hypothetical protein AUR04nite_05410 [Glutamicibacter uratoxydans]|uniref:Uncharacterized protein n=1 Tax=Glutamicibacter uratoxydans TaxID=43667 RepID=A0A4Y4DIA7_GLUUR|nr:hypothetical protein AUR04nite_05410 [Glutamicibacter uratoxydans]
MRELDLKTGSDQLFGADPALDAAGNVLPLISADRTQPGGLGTWRIFNGAAGALPMENFGRIC